MSGPQRPPPHRLLTTAVTAAVCLTLCSLYAHAVDAGDAAARALLAEMERHHATGWQGGEARTSLTLRLANAKERTWVLVTRSDRDGARLRSRATFVEPADSRGVELLVLEEKAGSTVQYLYLPKTRRTRRIGGSQRNAPFMGTDFSFADLQGGGWGAQADVSALADEAVGGTACHHLLLAFRPGADVAYGKLELWLARSDKLPRRIRFFDGDGKLAKTLLVEEVETIANKPVLRRLRMENHLRGSVTTVRVDSIEPAKRFPAAIFVPASLGN